LKLCALNVNGLKRRIEYPDFVAFIGNYDIFCISETHTDNNDIVDITGFTYFAKHRTQQYLRKSGGIGIYVRDNIAPHVTLHSSRSEYILWISIDKQLTSLDEPIFLGAIYIPPEKSRFFSEDLWNEFEYDISEKPSEHKYVYIADDTNRRIGRLRDAIISDIYFNDYNNNITAQALYCLG
jgi:exonuclease III